jgi:hypothetical protein
VLLSWYYQSYFAARNPALSFTEASPLSPGLFDLRGVTLRLFMSGAKEARTLDLANLQGLVPRLRAQQPGRL